MFGPGCGHLVQVSLISQPWQCGGAQLVAGGARAGAFHALSRNPGAGWARLHAVQGRNTARHRDTAAGVKFGLL